MTNRLTLADLQWEGSSQKEQERRENVLFHFFSVYADHYNKHRVGAQADFAIIFDQLGKTEDSKHRSLEKRKAVFKNGIILLSEQYKNNTGNRDAVEVKFFKTRILALVDMISMPEEICYPDIYEIIEDLVADTAKFVRLATGEENIDAETPIIKGIFDLYKYFIGFIDHRIHMTSLGLVIHKVNKEAYPQRIKLAEELGEQEREDLKEEVFKSFDLQKDDYWITAYELYSNDRTWEEVYGVIEQLRAELGLVPKYTSFYSFKRAKSRFDKKRSSGTK